ncbi:peroxidasin homolog [Zootermopsis nevadensis]|uniref:peroxidasin homolog n=1 Tax=Zootermopsis nevadensis TaxID=136037 RepID=UPI000B8E8DB8|nr:peroxidasin homolog [Zootermopsis nevadensis]
MLFASVCSVAALLTVAGQASDAERKRQFADLELNVTDYLSGLLEHDLRMRVGAAILAEKYAKNPYAGLCPDVKTICPPSKYRNLDGSCNNVRHPEWGTRGSPFRRLLQASYSDGVTTQKESQQLPSPAKVTKELHSLKAQPHEHVTNFLGVWGHMVLKDLASTLNSDSVDCCNYQHHECNSLRNADSCHSHIRSWKCQFWSSSL